MTGNGRSIARPAATFAAAASKGRMRRFVLRASICAVLVGNLLGWSSAARAFTVTEGYLPAHSGAAIFQEDLDAWLALLLPADAERLLVFTQCFGGNFVQQFAGDAATATASAQEAGKGSWYGGYHAGASLKFGPGLGRSGQDVHDGGVAQRDSRENPQTGGLLPLSSFSLSDNNNSAVITKHRRVLVYAALPDKFWDELDRSNIANHFAGQPLTVLENIGSNGGGFWDFAPTAKSLRDRVQQAGLDLASAPPGSPKQFLLFVTDHGGLGQVQKPDTVIPIGPLASVNQTLSTFSSSTLDAEALVADPENRPGFAIRIGLIPFDHTVAYQDSGVGDYTPLFAAGDWSVTVADPLGQPIFASSTFSETYVDLDGDGALTGLDEGVELFFPVPESLLLSPDLFDRPDDVTVTVTNGLDREYGLVSVALVTGAVAKVPEPDAAAPAAILALLALARRHAVGARGTRQGSGSAYATT